MQTTVVIIGGGQAGLAMSRILGDRSVDHVVLERGDLGQSWRTERWDSLRLLTPNWMTRLPGHAYTGDDPHGFMTAGEMVTWLEEYRRTFDPPVHTHTTVTGLHPSPSGYRVETDGGVWRCRAVVVATGASSTARRPALADALPPTIRQLHALHYRNPQQLDPGPVLVVGASASGTQIADELRRYGREVTLAVGDHVRLPRTYRGRDIYAWLQDIGQLDERYDEVEDLARARRLPSLQLAGTPERRAVDLPALARSGVQLIGRLAGVSGSTAQFSGSLPNFVTSADLKMNRLLDRVDEHIELGGLGGLVGPPVRDAPTRITPPPTELPLGRFATVIWATGYRQCHPWLDPSLLDRRGGIRHDGGVMAAPGMVVLGLPFLRRRKSSFIAGAGPDAQELAAHLLAHLDAVTPAA